MRGQSDSESWVVPAGQQFEKYRDSFTSHMEGGEKQPCNHKMLSENWAHFELKKKQERNNSPSCVFKTQSVQVSVFRPFPSFQNPFFFQVQSLKLLGM